MRFVVGLVIVVIGVLALPVTALLLDGIDAVDDVLVPIAAAVAAVLGAAVGSAGLDRSLSIVERAVTGVLWAALGFVLSLGGYFVLLGSLGS